MNNQFFAYFEQDNGCDYTIACGKYMHKLGSTNMSDAIIETKNKIKEEFQEGWEREISKATVFEISSIEEINIPDLYLAIRQEKNKEKEEENKRKELAELERLKQKYENK